MTQQPIRSGHVGGLGVARTIALACVDPWGRTVDVAATLRYRAEDPYAVALVFHSVGGDVEWVLARTLLLEGLATPAGDGDVRVSPEEEPGQGTTLDFCSPDGRLVARADTGELRAFLAATCRLVTVGRESAHLDLDRLIGALLGASS